MVYLCMIFGHNGHYQGLKGIRECCSPIDANKTICNCPRLITTNLEYLEYKYEQKALDK